MHRGRWTVKDKEQKDYLMKKKLMATLFLVSLMVTGCAYNSGVVLVDTDTFMVTRQAATGFSGLGTLKADAIREADEFCKSSQRIIKVTNVIESKPPYILGNYPRVELQFQCVGTQGRIDKLAYY